MIALFVANCLSHFLAIHIIIIYIGGRRTLIFFFTYLLTYLLAIYTMYVWGHASLARRNSFNFCFYAYTILTVLIHRCIARFFIILFNSCYCDISCFSSKLWIAWAVWLLDTLFFRLFFWRLLMEIKVLMKNI